MERFASRNVMNAPLCESLKRSDHGDKPGAYFAFDPQIPLPLERSSRKGVKKRVYFKK